MLIESVNKERGTATIIESWIGNKTDEEIGGRYDYENHYEKFDVDGSIRKNVNLKDRLASYYKNSAYYGNPISRLCVIRILNNDMRYMKENGSIVSYKISNAAMLRVNMPKMDIEKTVKISNDNLVDSQYILADVGDVLTYTITIKNNSNAMYKDFYVIENIDSRFIVENDGEGTLEDGCLKWNINSLEPGECKSISYVVRVPYRKTLYGSFTTSTGSVCKTINNEQYGVATSKIECLIGNKFSKSEMKAILDSYLYLKSNSTKTERNFINEIYKRAFNEDLGLSNNLKNLDIISCNPSFNVLGGKDELNIRYTNLKDSSIKKYVYHNFYGLRIGKEVSEDKSEVKASTQWCLRPNHEINDRARTLTPDMLINGDILLVYTGEKGTTDNNLVNKSYIFLNNQLIRKNGKTNKIEVLSGRDLIVFLRDKVCDNYILLRPSLAIDTTEKNYFVNNNYYETLEQAYEAVEENNGTIKVVADEQVIDSSKFIVEEGKTIEIDLNGKTIYRTSYAIQNKGTLIITDTSDSEGGIATSVAPDNIIANLIINEGRIELRKGYVRHNGVKSEDDAVKNWYTILNIGNVNAEIDIDGGKIIDGN